MTSESSFSVTDLTFPLFIYEIFNVGFLNGAKISSPKYGLILTTKSETTTRNKCSHSKKKLQTNQRFFKETKPKPKESTRISLISE